MMAAVVLPPEELNEQELLAVARALRRSRGDFALFFARCNLVPMRNRLLASLRSLLAPLEIHPRLVELTPGENLALLPERLAAAALDGQPVFVVGLENLMPSGDPWEALAALNHRRESYRSVRAPLVFWLPEYALEEVATHAGDFWAWRSGVYCFESDAVTLDQVLLEETTAEATELASLSAEEKHRRVRLLRGLLEDYQGEAGETKRVRAEVLLQLALLHFTLGELEAGTTYSEEVARIAQALSDPALEAAALGNLGFAHANVGQLRAAQEYLQDALRIWASVGDRSREGSTLNHLGNVFSAGGDYTGARRAYEKASEIARELGDQSAEGDVRSSLGGLEFQAGDLALAVGHLEEALKIARETGDRESEAVRLSNLALAQMASEQWEAAVWTSNQALALARELGSLRVELNALGNLGNAYLALGDVLEARRNHEQALVIARKGGDRYHEAQVLGNLANDSLAVNDWNTAYRYYQDALRIARNIGMTGLQAGILWNLSRFASAAGNERVAQAAAHLVARLRRQGLDGSGPRLPDQPVTPVPLNHFSDVVAREDEVLEQALHGDAAIS